jgi:hypothetical protein
MNNNVLAIRNALAALGNDQGSKSAASPSTVPTSRARAALDVLANSTIEELTEQQTNLREITESLMNWGSEPKATKNVIRALNIALNTPGKYAHAVELTAFLSAVSPLLQPDRLVRLFALVNEVDTAYAPSRFTLQLSHKLERLLKSYSEDRREKIVHSLWVQSHQGRWWDLTDGVTPPADAENVAEAGPEEPEAVSDAELLKLFSDKKLAWTPATAASLSAMKPNDVIRETLDSYNDDLVRGKLVDPDTAVLASHITWLAPLERPESPIGSLLDNLHKAVTELEYTLPEKPKSFSGMFPNVKLYGGATFPFPNAVLLADGRPLTATTRFELVSNATKLSENKTYMGNCTGSYKARMEKGEYALFRIIHGQEIYNASMITNDKNVWRVGEVNSRFNRGQVPTDVRAAFSKFVKELPPVKADNAMVQNIEQYKMMKKMSTRKYSYSL